MSARTSTASAARTSAPAPVVGFDASLIQGAGKQVRYRGATPEAYKAPLGALRAWAGAHPVHAALVGALTHHGWSTGGDVASRAANPRLHGTLSAAVEAGNLSAACYSVGAPTGPQIAAALDALATAGATTEHLAALWSCYIG